MPRASFVVVSLTALTLSSLAHAHGGPPAIENVLASDDQGPWLAELSEGFALRDADGEWSFVCPALFAADTPPVSATVGNVVWISGGMDLYQLTASRALQASDEPSLSSARVLGLGVIERALLALRVGPPLEQGGNAGTELVRLQGDTEALVFQDRAAFWNVLVVQSTVIWLARIDGSGFELLELSATGEEIARASTPWPTSPLSIRLGAAGEHVFVHVYDNLGYKLVHVATRGEALNEGIVIAEAQGPIRGPVELGDELLFTQDEQLLAYRAGATELSDSVLGSEALTCLTPRHACSASRLYAIDTLEAAGAFEPGRALIDLARLREPALRPDDPDLAQYCTAQWLVFQGDLARVGISNHGGVAMDRPDAGEPDSGLRDAGEDAGLAADASATAVASSSGCAITQRSDADHAAHLMSLGLCATAIYVRRRRAQAGHQA
jgi:hypothetical protein